VLVEKGYKPEHAYLEVAYQLDLIVDLIKKYGIEGMFERISVTARYGSLVAGPKIIDASVRKKMVRVFNEIESGRFARKLSRLTDKEISSIKKNVKSLSHPDLEKAAKKFSR
jgi:ketol-acid reductoisomerase